MGDKRAGVLASATSVLKRAVELDTANRLGEAVICYQEGLQLLVDVLRATPADKKDAMRNKMEQYMARAEMLKRKAEEQKEAGKYHEQIRIENNSTGHSYDRLLGRFLDEDCTVVTVEDPYVRSTHQMYNFLRLCELIVKSKANVQHIQLLTGQDCNEGQQLHQYSKLQELAISLQQYNVHLEVLYSQTLHDREIRLNNGWIIKIGRGLDIYKATDSKFSLGYCDFDLRKCHETTVDIFHSKHMKKTYAAKRS